MKTTMEWRREFWTRVGAKPGPCDSYMLGDITIGQQVDLSSEYWQDPFSDDEDEGLNMLELTWNILLESVQERDHKRVVKLTFKHSGKLKKGWKHKCYGTFYHTSIREAIVIAICQRIDWMPPEEGDDQHNRI